MRLGVESADNAGNSAENDNVKESTMQMELKVNGRHYLFCEILGSGAFGTVYKATNMKNKKVVAVKKVDLARFRAVDLRRLKEKIATEIKLMKECRHHNIVSLLDDFAKGPKEIYLVQEYCSGGDLGQYIDDNEGGLGEETARAFSKQIADGLMYLHTREPPIIHRDLKPNNILLSAPTKDAQLKITDFGEAQIKREVDGLTSLNTFAGTRAYMAPELLAKMGVDDDATYRSSGMSLRLSACTCVMPVH